MNICILSSDAFVPHSAALIASIMENKSQADGIAFHYFCENVSDKSKATLLTMKQDWDFDIHFYDLTPDYFDGYWQYDYGRFSLSQYNGSYMGYYKTIIPRLLPQEIDKVLFLDSDMIVQTSLAPLYETDIEGKYAAVVAESKSRSILTHDKPYFNAGMILMNVKKYREDYIEEQIKELAKTRLKEMTFLEQDMLNEVFQGNVVYVHPTWNGFLVSEQRYEMYIMKYQLCSCYHIEWLKQAAANPSIIHFIMQKPWIFGYFCKFKNIYWRYTRKTPFYRHVLHEYYNTISFSRFVKLLKATLLPKRYFQLRTGRNGYLRLFGKTIFDCSKKTSRQTH